MNFAGARTRRIALCGCVALYVFLSLLTFNQISEDAYIFFRHAAMLAAGHGYVFNAAGETVEAASNGLWLMLLTLFELASLDLVRMAKLTGIGAGISILVLTHRLAAYAIEHPLLRLLPSLTLAVSTPFVMTSQRGLGTALYAVVVLLLALVVLDRSRFGYWWIFAALVLPSRPEGFFILLALTPVFWLRRREGRAIGRGMLALGGIALVLLAVRFATFRDLVPNPFYIKMHSDTSIGLLRVHSFAFWNGIYVLALPLIARVLRGTFWTDSRVIMAGFVAVLVAWAALAADYMPYNRHLVPALPFLYVLIVGALEPRVAGEVRLKEHPWRTFGTAVMATAMVFGTLLLSQTVGGFQGDFSNPLRAALAHFTRAPLSYIGGVAGKLRDPVARGYLDTLDDSGSRIGQNYQAQVGLFLQSTYPQNTVIVYDQMGQTPWYAGLDKTFIDSWGLTDRTTAQYYFRRDGGPHGLMALYDGVRTSLVRLIAPGDPPARIDSSEGGGARRFLDYLFGREPDLILINRFVVADAPESLPALMRHDPRIRRDYELRYTLAGFVDVFERHGLQHGPPVVPEGLRFEPH